MFQGQSVEVGPYTCVAEPDGVWVTLTATGERLRGPLPSSASAMLERLTAAGASGSEGIAGVPFAYGIGERVEVLRDGEWHAGTVEDRYVGPVTREPVYAVTLAVDGGSLGFYASEIRAPVADAAWRVARGDADAARRNAQAYGGAIEDGRTSNPALAVLLAAEAICVEIRALALLLDYARADAR